MTGILVIPSRGWRWILAADGTRRSPSDKSIQITRTIYVESKKW